MTVSPQKRTQAPHEPRRAGPLPGVRAQPRLAQAPRAPHHKSAPPPARLQLSWGLNADGRRAQAGAAAPDVRALRPEDHVPVSDYEFIKFFVHQRRRLCGHSREFPSLGLGPLILRRLASALRLSRREGRRGLLTVRTGLGASRVSPPAPSCSLGKRFLGPLASASGYPSRQCAGGWARGSARGSGRRWPRWASAAQACRYISNL